MSSVKLKFFQIILIIILLHSLLIYSANLAFSRIIWVYDTGTDVNIRFVSIFPDPKRVIAYGSNTLYCLKPSSGENIWKLKMDYWIAFAESVFGDNEFCIIVGISDGEICLLNSAGSIIWSKKLSDSLKYYAVIEFWSDLNKNGIHEVAVGTENGYVFLIDLKDGDVLWNKKISDESIISLFYITDINGDDVWEITARSEKRVYCLSGKDGSVIWSTEVGEINALYGRYIRSLKDIDGDGFSDILTISRTTVFCLNGKTGSRIWGRPISTTPSSIDWIFDDLDDDGVDEIIVGSWNGDVYILSGSTGSILWHYKGEGTIFDVSSLYDDADGDGYRDVIAGSIGDYVYCISGKTGLELWHQKIPDGVISVTHYIWDERIDIDDDGVYDVLAGSNKGCIYLLSGKYYKDSSPPETTITYGPSGIIDYNNVEFKWTGSDDVTSTSNLVYSYKLEGYDSEWSSWTSSTSKQYNNLPNGNYVFKVKARDEVGNEDPTPAERSFTVNVSATSIITFSANGIGSDTSEIVLDVDGVGYTYSQLPVSFSWDVGSSHSFEWKSPISASLGKRFLWTSTSGLSDKQSDTITVPVKGGSISAVYKTQYYLTVTSPYGDPTGEGWYDAGSTTSLFVSSPVNVDSVIRYVCTGFTGTGSAPPSGTGTSVSFVINEPSSVTWYWKTQYKWSFSQTGLGADSSGVVLTVDGASYTKADLPASFWWDEGSQHAYAYKEYVASTADGKRYVCYYPPSASFTVTSFVSVNPTYHVEYRLTIQVSPAGTGTITPWWERQPRPIAEGVYWHEKDFSATVSASPNTGYVFSHWLLDGVNAGSSNPITVTMDKTRTLTAVFANYTPIVIIYTGSDKYQPGDRVSFFAKCTFSYEDQVINLYTPSGFRILITDLDITTKIGDYYTGRVYYILPSDAEIGRWTWNATIGGVKVGGSFEVTANYTLTVEVKKPDGATPIQGVTVRIDRASYTTSTEGKVVVVVTHGDHTVEIVSPYSPASGVRYVFTEWSDGDTSNPRTLTATGSLTVTAYTKKQYYLTVEASPSEGGAVSPGSGWRDEGEIITISASPAERYKFDHWKGFGVGSYTGIDNPAKITMNGPITETAIFVEQGKVIFTATGLGPDYTGTVLVVDGKGYGYSDLPVSFAWDVGSSHIFEWKSPLDTEAGKRYVWTSTSGLSTARSDTIIVPESGGSVSAAYKAQCKVTFGGSELEGALGTILIVDGSAYTGADLPLIFRWDVGSTHTFEWKSPVPAGSGKRYVWASTSGLIASRSGSITVPECGGKVLPSYKIQYELIIQSTGGGTTNPSPRSYWYDAESIVSVRAIPDKYHNLSYWMLDGRNVGSGNQYTVTMDSPHTIKAIFEIETYTVAFTEIGLPPETEWSVTFNGQTKTSTGKTITFTNITEGSYTWSASTPISGGVGARYVASTPSGTISIDTNKNVPVTYKLEYLLRIEASIGGTTNPAPGEYWCEAGKRIRVASNSSENYVFHYWLLDGSEIGSKDYAVVTIDRSHLLRAVFWRKRSVSLALNGKMFDVAVFTNSSVLSLQGDAVHSCVKIKVDGPTGTRGEIAVLLPSDMLREINSNISRIIVFIDGVQVDPEVMPEDDHVKISLSYKHSKHEISVFYNSYLLSIVTSSRIIHLSIPEVNLKVTSSDRRFSLTGITDSAGRLNLRLPPLEFMVEASFWGGRETRTLMLRSDALEKIEFWIYWDSILLFSLIMIATFTAAKFMRHRPARPEHKEEREKILMSPRMIPKGYEIIDRIGSGGFSSVWKVRRIRDGKIVALKTPKIESFEAIDKTFVNDFLREAKLWSTLKSPFIVEVYDFGEDPIPWISMELMEGGNLRSILRMGIMPFESVIEIGLKVTDALIEAHAKGVVHMDIKPENILFTKDGEPKVADWGLAKVLFEASSTSSAEWKGTLAYASPEQFDKERFGEPDYRTDIYQLGVVLYEMATGKLPFSGKGLAEIMSKIINLQPKPPSELNPRIPKEFDKIVMKALAKRKEDRYEFAYVLKRDLLALKKKYPYTKRRIWTAGTVIITSTLESEEIKRLIPEVKINVVGPEAYIKLPEKPSEHWTIDGREIRIVENLREKDKSNLQSLRSYILDIEQRMSKGDLDGVARRMIVFPLIFKGIVETLLKDEKLIKRFYNYCTVVSEDRRCLQNPEISKDISDLLETMRDLVQETLMRL